MLYEVRIATVDDVADIIIFLKNHWNNDHALVKSRSLLNFQHYNPITGKYNFIIAMNSSTKEIDGLLGYIPTYQYDIDLIDQGDYWGAIWKIRSDVQNEDIKWIATFLLEGLFTLDGFNSFGGAGISSIALRIYKALRMELGSLNQYYITNRKKQKFEIASNVIVNTGNDINIADDFSIKLININEINEEIYCTYRPKKSVHYLKNRYQEHPIYKYEFLGVFENDNLISIFAIRKITVGDARVLRVIDVYGNIERVQNIENSIQMILNEYDAEYIDFLNYGIDEQVFINMGFKKLDINSEEIIPNYFEPFIQSNIKLDCVNNAKYNYTFFKGDGDQDRPNII